MVLAIGTSPGLLFELEEVGKRRGTRGLILVWDPSAFGSELSDASPERIWSQFRVRFEETTHVDLPRHIDFNGALVVCFIPSGELRLIVGKRRTAQEWYAAFQIARKLVVGEQR